jgi:hypothetical protein
MESAEKACWDLANNVTYSDIEKEKLTQLTQKIKAEKY